MSEVTELHEPFMRWLKQQGILYRRSRSDKATSETCGEPDFSLHHQNRSLFIEMKQPKTGKLSKAQVFRQAEYERAGCHVWVVNELTLAINLVNEWRSQGEDRIPINHPAHKPTVLWKGASLRERPDGSFDRV